MGPKQANKPARWSPDELDCPDVEATPLCWKFRPLVYEFTETQFDSIRRYVYKGCDNSLIYAHILSPLASWLVEFLPRWVAPNVITLVALFWPLSAALIFLHECPSLNCIDAPRWPFLYCSIAILLYQTLDNMDGKQARRTKTSSPLGLFFDHGCDAITSVLSGICAGCWLAGDSMDAFTMFGLLTMCFTCFYLGAWEHYLQGEFDLPIVNGPNEGLIGASMISLWTFVSGVTWWYGETLWGINPVMFLWMGNYTGQVYTLWTHVSRTMSWLRSKPRGKQLCKDAATSLFPLVFDLSLGLLWSCADPQFLRSYPHVVLLLCGCVHIESCTSLMYCHMTQTPYSVLHFSMLPLGLAVANGVLGLGFGASFVHALMALSVCYISGCFVISIVQMKGALGIRALHVPSGKENDINGTNAHCKVNDTNGHCKESVTDGINGHCKEN